MSTFTPNVGLEKPAHGADPDSWDVPVNADWDVIDACFGNVTAINAVSASGTVTLTVGQYRPRIIIITGALTSNVNYQLPIGVGWFGSVFNATSGAQTITFSSGGGGTFVTLAQGATTQLICDGTNVGLASTSPGAAGGMNTQVQFNASGVLGGSSGFIFDGTNVGIGVSLPGAPLSVGGQLRIYGGSSGFIGFAAASAAGSTVYTLPSADGSSGQSLTTNGSGVLSWTTVGGGGGGGVSSFSGGSTGLTPSSPGTGVVTLGGVLAVASGGTGATSTGGNPLLSATNVWSGPNSWNSTITFTAAVGSCIIKMIGLPTADPHVVNQVWSNAGVLTLSAG